MKKSVNVVLTTALVSFLVATNVFAAGVGFKDIQGSPYRDEITALASKGILAGAGDSSFLPKNEVSRGEAAAMIRRAFRLVEITPMVWEENPDLEKENAYDDHLKPITEAFTVPSAKDIINHWGYEEIEGFLNARIDTVENRTYNPQEKVTVAQFALMTAKAALGPDRKIDLAAEAAKLGLISAENFQNNNNITREAAAKLLANIVARPDFKIITVFVTSDIHGNLMPYKPAGSNVSIGSLSKMSKIINDFRAEYGDVLLLDCGDSPYNTNIANLFEGASTVEVMNAMGYDATALGNHDFDFSFDILKRNAKEAKYTFLSANTYLKTGAYPEEFQPYLKKLVNGLSVSVVGITDDTSKMYTHHSNTVDIDFKPDLATVKEYIDLTAERSNLVIVLSHLHNKNWDVVLNNPKADIVIGGGNDLAGPPTLNGTQYMINPGKHAEALNQININMLDNNKLGVNVSQIFMSQNLPEDEKINEIVAKYSALMDEKFKEVVATTSVNLDGERGTVRLKESNLGNLIADSQLAFMEADIVLQNGGGIRASIPEGDITIGNIFGTLPFDNKLMMIEATGATVKDALENGVSQYPNAAGQFLQVAGIEYTFDASKPSGERIVSVTKNGAPLDEAAKYKVVINDFMAGGGDGYAMLKVLGEGEKASDVKILKETVYYLRDVMREYVAKQGSVAPKAEGRITILGIAN